MSERRACGHAGVCRATVRYEGRAEDSVNVLIREELRRLSERYRCYGTPRMTELVRRQGYRVNHKRVERLWKLEGLPLPRRRSRKRRRSSGPGLVLRAVRPNEVWSYDFIHDRTQYGQKLKMLTVLDECTRECLEIRVDKRMDSRHVMETLEELIAERGIPRYARSDNGAEFVSRRLTEWLRERGVEPVFIEPGSPWENGYLESFHGKLRDECLNEEIFWSRGEAQVVVDWYRDVYNGERPHSSLGYRTPAEVAAGVNTGGSGLALGLD
jgi:transposase InsO family protein